MLPRFPFAWCALAAIVACGSGGDPSAGTEVSGVLVVPANGGGSSPGFITGVALGTSSFLTATANSCGGDCNTAIAFASSFAPSVEQTVDLSGGATIANGGSDPDVAISSDGSAAFWAESMQVSEDGGALSLSVTLWTTDAAPTSGSSVAAWATFPIPQSLTQPTGGNAMVVGLTADADTTYVAVAQIPTGNEGTTVVPPDSPCWIQSGQDNCGSRESGHVSVGGFIFAVSRSAPGVSSPPYVPTTFDPSTSIHTLVDAGSSVCWLNASNQVTCASKGWASGSTPTVLAAPSLPQGWSLVATASNGSTVAWAASPDIAQGATGCLVWESVSGGEPTPIYDGSQASFFCRGLAIDAQYVYVTMNERTGNDAGSSCTNCTNEVYGTSIVGTGIARMPLTGGAMQTIALESPNWFGPRRVFVDDTYVYGVDPSYVLRAEKAAFGP